MDKHKYSIRNISSRMMLLLVLVCAYGCSDKNPANNPSDNTVSTNKLLRAEEAFKYEIQNNDSLVTINWIIEDGYYLYRNKINVQSISTDIQLGEINLPDGIHHEDEFFGVQQIYRNNVSFNVPYNQRNKTSEQIKIKISSQGCADIGICYPPQEWMASIDTKHQKSPASDSIVGKLNRENLLTIKQAFKPYLSAIDSTTLEIAFQIAPNYYLYKNKIIVTAENPYIQMGAIELPKGNIKTDEWFGASEVYFNEVFGRVAVSRNTSNHDILTFFVDYQGCLENELCLPPQTSKINVNFSSIGINQNKPQEKIKISEQSRLASLISNSNLSIIILTFFGAGLLLSFTPCVLPMIPILSGILAGEGKNISPKRGFSLALSYVMGMAIIYTVAGIISASIGLQLQAFFNAPWVVISFTILFVLLSLVMFEVIDLTMPTSLQTHLEIFNSNQRFGTLMGSFFIGAISSLIVTACVAPPLIATLIVIGQTGDIVSGGIALFSMSIGMGTPLLIIGTSAGKFLPKTGEWMNTIKHVFGFMMLGLAVYMLSRIVDASIILALWGFLALMIGISLGGLTNLKEYSTNYKKINKGVGLVVIIYGVSLILGSLSGNNNPMRPLAKINFLTDRSANKTNQLHFKQIKSISDLDHELALASSSGKSVMLDFYADWCVSCKEMEVYTFSNEAVQKALANTILIQADVTLNDKIDQALLRKLNVFGPPTIIFYDTHGNKKNGYEVVGYMKANEFAEHAKEAVKVSKTNTI
ncbi:MAG TPA: protein-disulfide reductase DsbD [Woeseiaceae bacterium]|mgnify:CR=1 FL=1|nr:protein-disulfide reductase DsbD [Woeseiaceae bacterium]